MAASFSLPVAWLVRRLKMTIARVGPRGTGRSLAGEGQEALRGGINQTERNERKGGKKGDENGFKFERHRDWRASMTILWGVHF